MWGGGQRAYGVSCVGKCTGFRSYSGCRPASFMNHGTVYTYTRGCRCDDCRKAKRDDMRQRRTDPAYLERQRRGQRATKRALYKLKENHKVEYEYYRRMFLASDE